MSVLPGWAVRMWGLWCCGWWRCCGCDTPACWVGGVVRLSGRRSVTTVPLCVGARCDATSVSALVLRTVRHLCGTLHIYPKFSSAAFLCDLRILTRRVSVLQCEVCDGGGASALFTMLPQPVW
jgi:hypothetical protein